MNWDKILVEGMALLIQCVAYKWAKHRIIRPEVVSVPAMVVIMPVTACVVSILVTSTVYGPVGVLVLSVVLLYWKALREGV